MSLGDSRKTLTGRVLCEILHRLDAYLGCVSPRRKTSFRGAYVIYLGKEWEIRVESPKILPGLGGCALRATGDDAEGESDLRRFIEGVLVHRPHWLSCTDQCYLRLTPGSLSVVLSVACRS